MRGRCEDVCPSSNIGEGLAATFVKRSLFTLLYTARVGMVGSVQPIITYVVGLLAKRPPITLRSGAVGKIALG